MARRVVSTATAQFHPEATGGARDFILIFGDEVDTTGTEQNGRSEVVYRARTGWVLTSQLGTDHPAELYFIDVGQGDAGQPGGARQRQDGRQPPLRGAAGQRRLPVRNLRAVSGRAVASAATRGAPS